ncbi:4199_t:CDS:2, partial [Racocetra persica]
HRQNKNNFWEKMLEYMKNTGYFEEKKTDENEYDEVNDENDEEEDEEEDENYDSDSENNEDENENKDRDDDNRNDSDYSTENENEDENRMMIIEVVEIRYHKYYFENNKKEI